MYYWEYIDPFSKKREVTIGIKMIVIKKKLILILLVALGLIALPLGKASANPCAVCIDPSHTVDKETAKRGEVLTYTIRVENVGTAAIDPVFVAETLSPHVAYLSGSTWAYKGSASVNVTDAWLSDGLNLGVLDPGQVVRVEFQARVKEEAPAGAFIESVAQIKKTWLGEGVNEWIQCAAQTTLIDHPQYTQNKVVDKATAIPGEILTYTITVKNTGDVTLHSVFIADTLPGFVTYIAGSTWAHKGGASVNVTDAWLSDGLNLGELAVDQTATVVFKVKINDNAPNGQLIENVAQFKTEEFPNWIQCAAQTTVKVGKVLGKKEVPKVLAATGPEHVLATSLYLGYLGFLLRRLKLTKFF